MQTLRNKVVVITGAASAIGRALALECGRRGARLLRADLDEHGLMALSTRLQSMGVARHCQRMDAGNSFIKSMLLATYALAIASLFVTMPFDAGPMQRGASLILLAIHLLELVCVRRHVRLYQGPLTASIVLTMLFGLLHWKPLDNAARARQSAT